MSSLAGKVAIVTGAGRHRSIGRPIVLALTRGGRNVNVSSIAGRQDLPNFGAYATTKAGLILFTQVLAVELARYRINVNCICPGLVDTYRMEDITRGPARDVVMRTIPLGREGDPAEIGELAAFLCGPDAAYIPGLTIHTAG